MSLGDGAERTLDLFKQEDGGPDFIPCVTLRVEFGSGYILPRRTVIDGVLKDVFGITLYDGHLGSAGAKRRC